MSQTSQFGLIKVRISHKSNLANKEYHRWVWVNRNKKGAEQARMIQKVYRGYITRKKLKPFIRNTKAALTIQRIWRGYISRKKEKPTKCIHCARLEARLNAEIQQRNAMYETMRLLWDEVRYLREWQEKQMEKLKHKNAIVIQRYWRGYYERKIYKRIRRDFEKFKSKRRNL